MDGQLFLYNAMSLNVLPVELLITNSFPIFSDYGSKAGTANGHYFHQDLLEKANQGNGRDATYQKMRANNLDWAQGTLNKLLTNEIDLLLGCTYGPAWVSTLGKGDTFADATWITMAPLSR